MSNQDSRVSPTRKDVWQMFDRIAPRYDLLNRLLSFRQDMRWRKKMAFFLPDAGSMNVLDIATGTGDQIVSLLKNSSAISKITGIDMSEKMLERGREKMSRSGWNGKVHLQTGDGTRLDWKTNSFNVVTISFGIRNTGNVQETLREMYRVLIPKGRALILEFSLPSVTWIKKTYLFYFRHILPSIGGWISGDRTAYQYLNQTVESFPSGASFCDMMSSEGFKDVKAHPLTLGIATIYQGDKKA